MNNNLTLPPGFTERHLKNAKSKMPGVAPLQIDTPQQTTIGQVADAAPGAKASPDWNLFFGPTAKSKIEIVPGIVVGWPKYGQTGNGDRQEDEMSLYTIDCGRRAKLRIMHLDWFPGDNAGSLLASDYWRLFFVKDGKAMPAPYDDIRQPMLLVFSIANFFGSPFYIAAKSSQPYYLPFFEDCETLELRMRYRADGSPPTVPKTTQLNMLAWYE